MENNDLGSVGGRKRGRWGQERRLEFIDSRLFWEGRLNRSALTDFFRISVPQASLDLAEYQRLAPSNVAYDVSQKAYVATAGFQPVLTEASSARYLAELYALSTGLLNPDLTFLGSVPAADVVRHPARLVPVSVLRQTLSAIRERRSLAITYQSMSHPEPRARVISPHALGYDGGRWHIRAYCHSRNEYRDFVFARISELRIAERAIAQPSADVEWNRFLDIVIAPNPEMAEGPRRAIELDYGMQSGRLVVSTRQALAFYLLERLGMTSTPLARQSRVQHIVLANRDELLPYFPQLSETPVRRAAGPAEAGPPNVELGAEKRQG